MTTQHYPPEYLAEDISGKLLSAAITMAVLDTTVIALMYASRWCAKGERKGMGMEIFMTISYFVCLGKITVAIRKSTQPISSLHSMELDISKVELS